MIDPQELEFGLDTFGDMQNDDSGKPISAGQTIRNVVEQAVFADSLGLDHFSIGEHHRDDFAVSAPDTVLAGIATRTSNIKLGTGVTVLSSDDPGSFIESFPLFGYELSDYGVLFEEKLELLVEILKEHAVTWSGKTRAPLNNQEIYPKTERGSIPLRVGVGGTPESVVRAARLNAKLAIAIIGGDPARFAPFSDLYRTAMKEFGHELQPISIHSPGHISDSDEQAIEELWPHYEVMFGRIGRERGWGPTTKSHFVNEVKHGSFYVGTPETVARKIAYAIKSVGVQRFDFKYSNGPMAHSKLMKSIELYATQVVPMVRELLATERVS